MEDVSPKLRIKDILAYLVAYGLWMICAILGLIAVFQLHNTLNFIWPLINTGNQWRWTLRPVNNFGLVFFGLLWLGYVIFIEQHFRNGVTVLRAKRAGLNVVTPIPDVSDNAFWRFLRRLNVDIVIRRFAVYFVAPAAVFIVAWGLEQVVPTLFRWLRIGIFR